MLLSFLYPISLEAIIRIPERPHFKTHGRIPLDLYALTITLANMQYRIQLWETDEGWSVSCPDLHGCHSQGESREKALENITEAIRLWLEVEAEENGIKSVETMEIAL